MVLCCKLSGVKITNLSAHPCESRDPYWNVRAICRLNAEGLKSHMTFYVYMLANQYNGTLYIGHTDDLAKRVHEHKTHAIKGFTSRYNVTRLVWFEAHETRDSAFQRERQMKVWKRDWKIALIETANRHWDDLFDGIGPTIR
jgi:putative endonuclease